MFKSRLLIVLFVVGQAFSTFPKKQCVYKKKTKDKIDLLLHVTAIDTLRRSCKVYKQECKLQKRQLEEKFEKLSAKQERLEFWWFLSPFGIVPFIAGAITFRYFPPSKEESEKAKANDSSGAKIEQVASKEKAEQVAVHTNIEPTDTTPNEVDTTPDEANASTQNDEVII